MYEGQRLMRRELKIRWIEGACPAALDRDEARVTDPALKTAQLASNVRLIVKWYNVDKGFGFATGPFPSDIFFGKRVLRSIGIKSVSVGHFFICDVGPGN